jgi:hypothetical protein
MAIPIGLRYLSCIAIKSRSSAARLSGASEPASILVEHSQPRRCPRLSGRSACGAPSYHARKSDRNYRQATPERALLCPMRMAKAEDWLVVVACMGAWSGTILQSCCPVASPSRPPLRVTRASSVAAASGRETNMTPNVDVMQSKR